MATSSDQCVKRGQKGLEAGQRPPNGFSDLGPSSYGGEYQCTKELCTRVLVRARVPHQLNAKPHRRNRHGDRDERHLTQKRCRHTARHPRHPIGLRRNRGRGGKAGDGNRDVAMETMRREEFLDDAVTDPGTAERQETVDVSERVELLITIIHL